MATTYTLISAKPSPYARKVRVALAEKQIPFTLQTEVPWDSTTQTPQYNPLEKLPILIVGDGSSIYESHLILEYLEAKHPTPALLPKGDIDATLLAKQIEVVADGICDALVLLLFEKQREADKQSEPWRARQTRKVTGGIRALATWVEKASSSGNNFLVGDALSIADIAACSVLGYLNVRWPEIAWQTEYPHLKAYWENLERRESFKETRPEVQVINDRIV